jgi:hypothetical protein
MESKFLAAAVQAEPVYFNALKTAEKAAALIDDAGRQGAQLVTFPETWLPGYPYRAWFARLGDAPFHPQISPKLAGCRRIRRANPLSSGPPQRDICRDGAQRKNRGKPLHGAVVYQSGR